MGIRKKNIIIIICICIISASLLMLYYQFFLGNDLEMKQLYKTGLLMRIIRTEVVLISIVFILLGILNHLEYLSPIMSIKKSMKEYKIGILPKKTERKDEFGYLQNTFVDITENLEKEKQKQNRIIASISHDIKTPLTSIMGYTERLKKGNLPPEKEERYIEVIYEKSKEIKELIEDFDEYLSYNLQKNLNKQNIKIEELLEIIKSDYIEELEAKGITLETVNQSNESINIDINKFRRVFGNLINNSIKHLDKDEKLIKIEVKKEGNKIRFTVADNGTGVKEEELERIFEALYTEDKARKVAGFGLSICKEIINSHEGKIWAENNELGGLSIIFEV